MQAKHRGVEFSASHEMEGSKARKANDYAISRNRIQRQISWLTYVSRSGKSTTQPESFAQLGLGCFSLVREHLIFSLYATRPECILFTLKSPSGFQFLHSKLVMGNAQSSQRSRPLNRSPYFVYSFEHLDRVLKRPHLVGKAGNFLRYT
jgi:hypothetical protein